VSDKERPVRVRFLYDDPAQLWSEGDTADDLGFEYPGSPHRLLRLDHYDDLVGIVDPYGRGIIAPLDADDEKPLEITGEVSDKTPPGFSDAELDAWLDAQERKEPDDDQ
jgi:hypothetical protein